MDLTNRTAEKNAGTSTMAAEAPKAESVTPVAPKVEAPVAVAAVKAEAAAVSPLHQDDAL